MAATAPAASSDSPVIRSLIPARIDRLPWSKFHTRMVTALGVAWVLDGLEITIAANVGPDLTHADTLNMSAGAVADMATWYLIGQVIGALFFGRLSDKLGRRNLFMITLAVYQRPPAGAARAQAAHLVAPALRPALKAGAKGRPAPLSPAAACRGSQPPSGPRRD
jgi:MFS family permease